MSWNILTPTFHTPQFATVVFLPRPHSPVDVVDVLFYAIPAVVMSNLKSDRICGIQVPIEGTRSLTILGVYMPSSDQPQEVYNDYTATINQTISNTSCSSPLLVVGDLNCHLGQAGGPRSSAEPNHRGMQWKDLIDSHSLYVPSLSHLATGPVNTYSSGSNSTTPDYIIGNFTTSTVMVACRVEEEHPLNTSDHLPISSKLNLSMLTTVSTTPNHIALDWTSAIRDNCISQYASQTDQVVSPLLNKDYSSIEEIEADISHVSKQLIDSSLSTIPPLRRPNTNSTRVHDSHLSTLCWRSRHAYRQWKAAGRSKSGPLYEARKLSKKNVQHHLSKC